MTLGADRSRSPRTPPPGPLATAVPYAAFFATGIGLVLPGAMLPTLLARWSMNDARAGLLFFVFFLGSMAGAVLSRGRLPQSIARGCLATLAGASGLLLASANTAFLFIALYGLGLGVVMTSVSLLRARAHPSTRASEMARLNLTWSLGACVGPSLALKVGTLYGLAPVLLGLSAFFALTGALAWAAVPHVEPLSSPAPEPSSAPSLSRVVPILLFAAIPLSTGIESASGGWLATYAERSGHGLSATIGAATCLWAGMLLSRAVQAHRAAGAALSSAVLRVAPILIAASLVLLLTAAHGPLILLAAFLLGIGAGPMYPLLLALALENGEAGNTPFLAAGIGASVLPLLTGTVSRAAGSLRAGLCVPLAAAALMALLCTAASRRRHLTPANP